MSSRTEEKATGEQPDAEVEAVLAEFGGDARAAIRALLHDLAVLAADAEASTSRGFVRGKIIRLKARTNG